MTPTTFSALGLFVATSAAHAADTTSIALRGYVPETSSVQLSDVNPIVSNDLRMPVRGALVARVLEQSNSISGYTIKLISENGRGRGAAGMINEQAGTIVPYTVSYGGESLRFVNGQAELHRTRPARAQRTRESDLRISSEGSDRIVKGEYTDILTIAVTAR